MADVATAQPRRSRRFSFTSRRSQSVVIPNANETTSSPPVTTIGFPIDAFPVNSEAQQERSSWRNVFRRSQSVDRTNSRAPSSDRQSARRLVKKPPVQGLHKDAKLSAQVPTLPDISLISNESNSSNSGRPKDARTQPTKTKSSPISSFGRGRTDAAFPQQRDNNQLKARTSNQPEIPPAPATPTLRRVGSPFYHTASDRPAVEAYGVRTTVTAGQRKSSLDLDTSGEDCMIPDSLRVSRSKTEPQPTATTTKDKSESPTRGNFFNKLNASDFDLPDYPTEQMLDDSIANLSLRTDKTSSRQSLGGIESYDQSSEQPKPIRPLKTTTTSRPHHAKTPSSSSSSSAASSAFSALGEPATPVSSNASSTYLDSTTSFGSSSAAAAAAAAAKKETIPRNTMSPKHDKYLAKIFVVCCHCNYWHDVPSGLYAQMVIPESLLFSGLPEPSGARSSRSSSQARSAKSSDSKYSSAASEASSFTSKPASSPPKATVKCSWCRHEMAKSCCASWTTMVHLIEKHH